MSELPRYDFYQTNTHLVLSLYLKGYNTPSSPLAIDFQSREIIISLPPKDESSPAREIVLGQLYDTLSPGSTFRVLSTKIELKLVKSTPTNWPTLLSAPGGSSSSSSPSAPAQAQLTGTSIGTVNGGAVGTGARNSGNEKRDWDKVVVDSLGEEGDDGGGKDPNQGEAALTNLFATLYKDADPDTRRAMIKSYTESGGTALSTDWKSVSKETVAISPPDGMEAKKY